MPRTVTTLGTYFGISGSPSSMYYRTQATAARIAAQMDAADLIVGDNPSVAEEDAQDAAIVAADDTYLLTKVTGEDSTGGTQQLPCVGALIGDVVASWLRLDASGGAGKGVLENATDLASAMFVTPVSVNGELHQIAGSDQSAYQFVVLLKRTPTS